MIVVAKSQETMCFHDVGGNGPFLNGSIFFGLVLIPSSDTMCPRYSNFHLKNSHLDGFNFSPNAESFSKTMHSLFNCSSSVLENTMMSSK